MKRLAWVVVLLLLLVGCTDETSSIKPVEVVTEMVENLPYMESVSGSIRRHVVSQGVDNLEMLDSGVLLLDQHGNAMLVDEDSAEIKASKNGEKTILCARSDRIIGYVSETSTVVVWDSEFNIISEYDLENGVAGDPVACEDEVYYCVNDYIRALNLETGLTRNIMQFVPEEQTLSGAYFGGRMIGWHSGDITSLVSTVDGQVVFHDSKIKAFSTGNDSYFAVYQDGVVNQYIWGTLNDTPMQLEFKESQIYPQMNCSDIIVSQNLENGLKLMRFNMDDRVCVGSIEADGFGDIIDVVSSEVYTWILTSNGLYRWDYSADKPETQENFFREMVTSENPDTKALTACSERAKQISERYGIDIYVWQDAVLYGGEYVIAAEYQTDVINEMLEDVDSQLSGIPTDLLKITDEYCGLQICLVRSIRGDKFIQYLTDDGFCMAITPEADIQEAILTGLGWGIDSCVIGNSRDLDYWDDLNPFGFSYDYDYIVNEHRTDTNYITGKDRAFVDKRAMSFPSEDRARIFYYAMTDGNEELFSSPTLQAKLKTFCEGIREAYGWQKETVIFQWEQYLEQSLAYTK